MKKLTIYICLIIGVSIAGIPLYAQKKKFDDIIDFGLPKKVKYLDSTKLDEFAQEKPNLPIITKQIKSNTYRLGDILIKANASFINKEKAKVYSVQDHKRFYDQLYGDEPNLDTTSYSSEIREIDAGKVLISYNNFESIGFIRHSIYGTNPAYDKCFSITIDYEKKDSNKAKKLAEHVLKHVKFK